MDKDNMPLESLDDLIKQTEGQNLEFKRRPSEELGKSICSFANTNGGIILVGISDIKQILGVEEKDEQKIASIAHTCKPSIYPRIERIKTGEKTVFVVKVNQNTGLIHSYKNIAYKRIGSSDEPLSPEEVIEFAKSIGKIQFDSMICEEASQGDIDEERVKWFLKKAKNERMFNVDPETQVNEALERLGVMRNNKLTNAGVLLFTKNTQQFFSQAEVRCARFSGTEPIKPFIDMKVFEGDIIDQVDKALGFVLEHTPMKVYLVGKPEREERYEYPPDAIREAIVNAICHRDYESIGNIQIRVFDDRIEVWNPGLLPEPLTLEDLKRKHKSIPRNPLVAKCFFLIKFIEQWGTGTNDMIDMCSDWKLPDPLFEYVTGDFVVTFRKTKYTEEFLEKKEMNERQIKAIEYLKGNKKITRQKYASLFGCSIRTAFNDIQHLVDKGLLQRKGKGRYTYYELV